MTAYLYIAEDGSLFESPDPPTSEDIDSISAGILSVIIAENRFIGEYDVNGDVIDLPTKEDTTQ